jgi:hypothetical protein
MQTRSGAGAAKAAENSQCRIVIHEATLVVVLILIRVEDFYTAMKSRRLVIGTDDRTEAACNELRKIRKIPASGKTQSSDAQCKKAGLFK